MDIPKIDSCKKIVFAVFLVLASGPNAFGQEKQPGQILIDSYKLTGKLTTETAEKTISELKQALALCTDDTLKFRLEYRVGMIFFKAGDQAKAVGCFEKVAQAADCPDLIRLCSLNMAGQIYRMQAKDDKALKVFEKLIEQSQKFFTGDPNHGNSASVLKLAAAAGFTRAEIYQYNQNYNSAIAEYKKIIASLKDKEPFAKTYAPLALDRMAQFYLIEGKVEDYNQTAAGLVEKYPDYYRVPILRLETEAVKILKQKEPSVNFPRGSFDAPAK
ncbi:MAG: tetratricopeptide repeat protein, partial [Planctomycetota bacterium]